MFAHVSKGILSLSKWRNSYFHRIFHGEDAQIHQSTILFQPLVGGHLLLSCRGYLLLTYKGQLLFSILLSCKGYCLIYCQGCLLFSCKRVIFCSLVRIVSPEATCEIQEAQEAPSFSFQ